MHTAFKGRCVLEGVTIQDKVRTLIEHELAADRARRGRGRRPFDIGGKFMLGSPHNHSQRGSPMSHTRTQRRQATSWGYGPRRGSKGRSAMTGDVARLTLTRGQRRLLDTSTAIRSAPPDRIDFLHTVQCQCGIPYKNPGDDVREWDRKQGNASLRIEAGSAIDPSTGDFVRLGLPYGEKPRLVLIHLATEAVRTGSPVVDVEESMTAFARSLGLETNGQQLRSLKDQLARLAAATVRMGVVEEGRAVQVNTQFVSAFDLWFPKQADQRVLWPSTVRLSEEYFQSLGKHAVPLDHRAVAALASSSMALDVYVWLAQRLHRVPAGKPQFIAWDFAARAVRAGVRPHPRLPPQVPRKPCTRSNRPTRPPACRPTTAA